MLWKCRQGSQGIARGAPMPAPTPESRRLTFARGMTTDFDNNWLTSFSPSGITDVTAFLAPQAADPRTAYFYYLQRGALNTIRGR